MLISSGFGYRFIPGVAQYSGGVIAEEGYAISRVTFAAPRAVPAAFDAIESYLVEAGLPRTGLCAVEMRSPEPFDDVTFAEFNRNYIGRLQDWGLIGEHGNPIARSNVCPVHNKPAEPSVYAFSYAHPAADPGRATFVVAGSAEVPEGKGNYADHIVAPGDVTPAGLITKADWVLGEMARRMDLLGVGWADTTGVQMYTRHEVAPVMDTLIARPQLAGLGVTWHFADPPIAGLAYEMDARAIAAERVR